MDQNRFGAVLDSHFWGFTHFCSGVSRSSIFYCCDYFSTFYFVIFGFQLVILVNMIFGFRSLTEFDFMFYFSFLFLLLLYFVIFPTLSC